GNLHPARLSAVGQLVVYERFSGHGARLGPLLERCGPDQLRDAVVWPDLLSGAGHFRRQLYLLNRGAGLHSNTAQPPARVSLHPDEALNWLYFAHDDYHAAGFLPEPKQWSNPGWNEVLEEQWRWWSRELLKQTVGDLDGSPATSLRIGRDAPGFGSLETAPELHAHCQRRWPDFRHWWNRQGAPSWLATSTMSRDVMDTVRDAQLALPTDARVTLYVVGLVR